MTKYFDEMKRLGWQEADIQLLDIHKRILSQFLDDSIYNSEIESSIGFLIDFAVSVQNIDKEF
jgi:hypothetical protein